jgi:hypothetical protein
VEEAVAMSQDSNTARDAMRALASDAILFLRRSDTFAWLTTKVPDQLDERAEAAAVRIAALHDASKLAAGKSADAPTDSDVADTVGLAEGEASFQKALATLLREFRGKDDPSGGS